MSLCKNWGGTLSVDSLAMVGMKMIEDLRGKIL